MTGNLKIANEAMQNEGAWPGEYLFAEQSTNLELQN